MPNTDRPKNEMVHFKGEEVKQDREYSVII